MKWGDPLVDCGREFDIAKQLSEGKTLYVDVRNYYGPLAPWIDGALFSLFGVHTNVFVASGLVCALLTSIVVFRLSRCFSSRLCSTSVTVLFLYACAFGHVVTNSIFNFVFPYAQAATYGILVCIASFYFLVRYLRKQRARDLILSLFFLYLSALTKMELIAAILATHVVALAGLWWSHRIQWWKIALGYAMCLVLIVGTYGILYERVGPDLFADNLLVLLNSSMKVYTQSTTGMDDWPKSLGEIAWSGLVLSAIAGAISMAAVFANRQRSEPARLWIAGAGTIASGVAYFLFSMNLSFRVVPVLAIVMIGVLFLKCWRTPESRIRTLPHLVLWVFSLFCLIRMGLRTTSYHYGFYLLIPSLVALGAFWFEYLPCYAKAFAPSHFGPRPASSVFAAGGVGIFLGLTISHFVSSYRNYEKHTVEIRTSNAHLNMIDNAYGIPYGKVIAEAIRLMGTQPQGTRIFAVPQGIGMVLFAGHGNPYGSSGLLSPEVSKNYDDEHLLLRLKALPPDLILRTPGTVGNFGVDYGQKTWAWVEANYEACIVLGRGNFVVFLKRKGAPFPLLDIPPEMRAQ